MRKTNPTPAQTPPQPDPEPAANERPNRAQLAKLMGVSLPTVDDWVRRGCPVAETGGKGRSYGFHLPDVIEWRVRQERKRQGLPAAGTGEVPAAPVYNPLRLLCYDAARSVLNHAWCTPLIEDMIDHLQQQRGIPRKEAARTVGGFFFMQRIALEDWTKRDFFSNEMDTSLDELLELIKPDLPFIRGVPPKLNFDEVGEGVGALFKELEGYGPVEPQAPPAAG